MPALLESPPSEPPRARSSSSGGFFLYVVPTLLYIGAVFASGIMRGGPAFPSLGPLPRDKVAHFVAFGGMALVVLRTVRFTMGELRLRTQLAVAVAVASVLGALLELVQAALPFRDAELLDWVADTLGALAAAAFAWRALRLPREPK
ncbi:MAG: VanZ family protein [Polyangiaceae bacterium]|nr:VanZ family protein [Polyangiaceae bacterium]